MKKLSVFLLVLGLTSFISPTTAFAASYVPVPGNVISNPSLEDSLTGFNPSWTADDDFLVGSSTLSISSSTEEVHSGNKAAKVEITDFISGDAKWGHTAVAVTPGEFYTFKDWYKSSTSTEINIAYNYSDFQWISSLPAASDWTLYETSFIVPPGVTSIQLYHILAGAGTLITDDYSLVKGTAPIFPEGRVSLTFDDGWKSFFTYGVSILNTAGLKATAYVNTYTMIPDQFPDYMNSSDLITLQKEGHEIGGHSYNHADLTLPETNLALEINDNRTFLKGIASTSPVDTFAYPYGAYNDAAVAQLKAAGYIGARSVDEGYNFTNSDPFKLKIQHVTDLTTPAEIQGWINTALTDKTWLILMFHEIVPNNGVGGDCEGTDLTECASVATLQSTATYLKNNTICVLTMTEALHNVPCNTAPILNAIGSKSITAFNPLTFVAQATDNNSDSLTYSISNGPAGATIGSTTGAFSWTPTNDNIGTTSVTVLVTDGKGGNDSEVVNITVMPDIVAPIISIPSLVTTNDTTPTISGTTNDSASVLVLLNGKTYLAGASTGIWSVALPEEDILADGSYTISASSTDAAGNISSTVSGTLVINTEAPNLTVNAPATNSTLFTGTTDADVTSVMVSINGIGYSATLSTTLENWQASSTAVFSDGIYPVSVSATDSAGNIATVETSLLIDHSSPVFSMYGNLSGIEATSPEGASLNFEAPTTTDASPVTVICTPAPGALFTLGTTTVTCTADDSFNPASSMSFDVGVVDTTGPIISGPDSIMIPMGTTFSSPISAKDAVEGDLTSSLSVSGEVNTNVVANYTLVYKVSDSKGNVGAEKTLVVNVLSRNRGGGGGGSGGRVPPKATTTLLAAPAVGATNGVVLGASSSFTFTLTLQLGSTGEEVTALQNRLITEGVYSGPVTGYFGVLTETAVKKYQEKKGLDSVGFVGPQTRLALNAQVNTNVSISTVSINSSMSIDQMKALLVQLQAQLAALMAEAGNQ